MELNDMIPRRRSVRKYDQEPVSEQILAQIRDFCRTARPLYPNIRTEARLVSKEDVRFYFPWKAPHLLAIYSENKPCYLENVGFVFQQVDLYLQSLGLGSCWMGLGKLRSPEEPPEGMDFVILLAFGHTEGDFYRTALSDFQRNPPEKIADYADQRLDPARLAPSSTNSQPWFFIHDGDTIHAYRNEQGLLRHRMLGAMNQIDIGIALAHLYLANTQSFRFFHADTPVQLSGYSYTGSFTI